ncbi:hypothetical protein [Pseudoduganella buxea]|uniref:Lipoprotein n=1 Tax=Pseudoduganella buxea TaxID=1949069 RepID=A0A6I3T1F6_9BURK|nr:hypothetical protein [Pseudoduganella buxea]MTV53477.1 hypothetical protein [Pseudoduganella buxea]GGB95299.1 hypothetical protein GCM10011572_16600 [Pseudoduganella buxea]
MKSMTLRASVSALCAVMLAGCGGSDDGNLVLQVTVTGLTKTGLILQNGNETITINGGTGGATQKATFPTLIPEDSTLAVKIAQQPLASNCKFADGTNGVKANYYSALRVEINCTTNSYTLGGTVSGLTSAGLKLNNGANVLDVPAGATSFTFSDKQQQVADGAIYAVTVASNPAGLVCDIANNAGVMPSGPVTNIAVTCRQP